MARAQRRTSKEIAQSTGLPVRDADSGASTNADPAREGAALRFCISAAKSLEGNKCTDILVLDLRGRSQITDFFVIASGTSDRQMHSAAEHVAEHARSGGLQLFRSNLDEARSPWLVLDFVDSVVHIFMPETRLYYDLEMLWGDAPRIEWKVGAEARPSTSRSRERNRAGLKPGDVLPGRKR